ncbi:Dihydrofolate reductase-like protein [Glarea lozoyensis ATCC 20868]|uniref:2,5-diamino-6-ribosylamino-4(3H)-pyrimidinone 5'-phosphate reductase n=1 Tax=Glarea lozoyensis (strain ATCC 20868 / MF5171) TaxID=1116229 RepID=S3DH73_GLAL2|nr:Dihydrofolate reductase-like protein [Glarea lozoyensis ATCC 20868]EPE36509.1 Dihydrofolate reductase-like protein [Glarea lozoyensis ATCC 20868]
MPDPPRDVLHYPSIHRTFLEPHLPPKTPSTASPYPFTTLTFATSLDSQLALSPGAPTALSGPESKAMTHYLRSRHDAILIGVGTAVADNPSLNCRIEGVGGYGGEGLEGQPRPIVLDPRARWEVNGETKVLKLAREGRGKAPFIITTKGAEVGGKREVLEGCGGKFIEIDTGGERKLGWRDILRALKEEGLNSVMIEGGAGVINELMSPENAELVSFVIVTIAPTWLGKGGVVVLPDRRNDSCGKPIAAARLDGVKWYPLGEDVVLCGKMKLDG